MVTPVHGAGAFVVQRLAQRLDALLEDSPHTHSTKECSCVLMVIAFLYCYRVRLMCMSCDYGMLSGDLGALSGDTLWSSV